MSSRKRDFQVLGLQISDALLLGGAVAFAWKVRTWQTAEKWVEKVFGLEFPRTQGIEDFTWLMYLLMPVVPIALDYFGFYRRQNSLGRALHQIVMALGVALLLLGVLAIFFKTEVDSRLVIIFTLFFAGIVLLGRHLLRRWWHLWAGQSPQFYERVLLAGHPEDMRQFREEFDERHEEVMVVAEFDLLQKTFDEFVQVLHREAIERVFICAEHLHLQRMEKAVQVCELEGVSVWLSTRFLRATEGEPQFEKFAEHPMLVFRSAPDYGWQLFFKDVLDRLGALALLIVASPIMLWIAWRIKRSDPGPAIFTQQRGGKHGKPFTLYKFRSMYTDAEARREELMEKNKMSGPVFKVDDDPRIFSFGHFIRRTSLDELPQLVNVFLGQMSLVGPRPLPVYEVEQIAHSRQRRRLSVKPGLTCLWQISGRNEITDFDEWVALDLEYIDNWSFWSDLKILWDTVPAVLLRKGAK